jgi:hypothetical protein
MILLHDFENRDGLLAVIAVRQALARIAKNGNRASEVIGRIQKGVPVHKRGKSTSTSLHRSLC